MAADRNLQMKHFQKIQGMHQNCSISMINFRCLLFVTLPWVSGNPQVIIYKNVFVLYSSCFCKCSHTRQIILSVDCLKAIFL